jgi:hypothetical protein
MKQVRPAKWFESWREVGEFYRAADEGLETFFGDRKVPSKYLREAYVAGVFARIWRDAQGPCQVRLVPEKEQFPDAQLKTEARILDLESTMADEKDRPMFKIWREILTMYEHGEAPPIGDAETKQKIAREAITRVCRQKVGKHYASQKSTSLLIYVNAGPVLSAKEMARLTESWKDSFEAIYLLCGMDAVMVWPEVRVLKGKEPL